MKTIKIKGKDYVTVNERLKYFREKFADFSLLTEIVEFTDKRAVIKATVVNPEGKEVANGVAYELHESSGVNKTSFLENCETSAWGRALANFGIGIEQSVASADEVRRAINQQDEPEPMTFEQEETIHNLIETSDITNKQMHQITDEIKGYNSETASKCISFLKDHQVGEGRLSSQKENLKQMAEAERRE